MCGEVVLEAATIPEYLDRTVKFLNGTVWGTLSTTLVLSEESLANLEVREAVKQSIADLWYGTIALNASGVWGFASMIAPRGGYPDSDLNDIQSGNEKVGNFLMLNRPEKTVTRVLFQMQPYPFLGTTMNFHVFCKKLTSFQMNPSYWKLPGLFWTASQN
jgi:aldehyde dehydrogenase (NAD(P)+)